MVEQSRGSTRAKLCACMYVCVCVCVCACVHAWKKPIPALILHTHTPAFCSIRIWPGGHVVGGNVHSRDGVKEARGEGWNGRVPHVVRVFETEKKKEGWYEAGVLRATR